ncbi:MAG: hypothetical protein EZS28_035197, partial [Streblomastix strix]
MKRGKYVQSDKELLNVNIQAIRSIINILSFGAKYTPSNIPHPYFECIQLIGGIDKLFALFRLKLSQESKDGSSICLGFLYRSREMPEQEMKEQITEYLQSILNDPDSWKNEMIKASYESLTNNKAQPINELTQSTREIPSQNVGLIKSVLTRSSNDIPKLSINQIQNAKINQSHDDPLENEIKLKVSQPNFLINNETAQSLYEQQSNTQIKHQENGVTCKFCFRVVNHIEKLIRSESDSSEQDDIILLKEQVVENDCKLLFESLNSSKDGKGK